jgi:hypothetical protein
MLGLLSNSERLPSSAGETLPQHGPGANRVLVRFDSKTVAMEVDIR